MPDYINRDDALAKKRTLMDIRYGTGSRTIVDVPAILVSDIEDIPAEDVRPVVYCKKCIHFAAFSVINTDGTGKCGLRGKYSIDCLVDEYDFCSGGERRDGGTDG